MSLLDEIVQARQQNSSGGSQQQSGGNVQQNTAPQKTSLLDEITANRKLSGGVGGIYRDSAGNTYVKPSYIGQSETKFKNSLTSIKTGLEKILSGLSSGLSDPDIQGIDKRFKETQAELNAFRSRYKGADLTEIDELSREVEEMYEEYISKAQSGLDAYGAWEAEQRQAEEDKPWYQWLFETLGQTADTTLPGAHITQAVDAYREDDSPLRPADEWEEYQKNLYGYLYADDKDRAGEYARYANESNSQQAQEEKRAAIEEWATKNGFNMAAGTIASVVAMPLSLADTMDYLAQMVGRGYITTNPDVTPGQFANTVRGAVSEDLNEEYGTLNEAIPVIGGKGWGDVYQLGTSIADSMAAGRLLGPLGTYVSFFGSASASGIENARARGATDEQAIWLGIANGLAEAAGEAFSVDKLLKTGASSTLKDFFFNIIKQSGVEASEEGVTTLINNLADQLVMQDQSEFNNLVLYYTQNGMSQEEAKKQAWKDMAESLAYDMLSGFVSGGVSSGIQTGVENVLANKDAKRIYGSSAAELVEEGLELDPSNKLVNKMQGRLDRGKSVSGSQLRNLAEQNQAAILKQDRASIETAAASRLTELGETGDVQAIAKALTKQAAGESLSRAEREIISKSKYGQRVSNELNPENIRSGEYASGWAENIGTNKINAAEYNRVVETTQVGQEATDKSTESGVPTPAPTSIEEASKKYGAQAGAMLHTYQQGQDVEKYDAAYQIAYDMGKEGGSLDYVKKSPATAYLSETQIELAYEAGTATRSASGKAVIAETDEEVSIKSIASIKDGEMILELADGKTVKADELSFASEDEAQVYETVAKMGVSAEAANVLVANYDSSTSAEVYANGIQEAYNYGRHGSMENMEADKDLVKALTAKQREAAFKIGKEAKGSQVKAEATAVEKAYEKAKAKVKAGKGRKNELGKVVFRDNIKEKSLTKAQKTVADMGKVISGALGVDVYIYSGMTEYGKYDKNSGTIWLNVNANISGHTLMHTTLSHELVHFGKQWSPEKFQAFADFLIKEYGKKGLSINEMIAAKKQEYAENGIELTEDEAYEEVIAEAASNMLTDSNAVERLAKLSNEHPDIIEKIKEFLKDLLERIQNLFGQLPADSNEAQLVREMEQETQKALQNLFTEMLIDAGEHYSTIRNAFGKNTSIETNENGEFLLARNNGSSKARADFLFNAATWENGGRDTLEAALRREGFSADDVKAALTIMDGKYNLVKQLGKEYAEQERISQIKVSTDIKAGKSVVSALVTNGDYPVNIDLLMVCKKRQAYQKVINRLCETGMIQKATVDSLAIAEINKILGKYGFETACLGCFVESRRLRVQEWANTICQEWNTEVKKRNPNAKAFGFGKGEAELTQEEVMQLVSELESGGEKNEQGNLNLGQGSAVKRMGVLMDKVPSLQKTLTVEDLITPQGLTALRRHDSNLFSMVKSRYGSNSPKYVQDFNPYNSELAKYGKVPTEYESLREYLYAIGGARMQSFSDFIVENWFDYTQIVADLAARKLPMHTYTKEIALAKLFGMTGIKINMSLIPDIDRSLDKEYAGLTLNEKGEYELIWADKDRFKATGGKSYMQSFNFADAIALQEDPRYSANVGTIAVGISDKHIEMMLDDPRIRMVIPYHSSGMNPIYADMVGSSYYKDYTMTQNTTVAYLIDSKGNHISRKLTKEQAKKLTAGFEFNKTLQELGDARAAAEAYKEWCRDASKHSITIGGESYTAVLTPKFNQFAYHDNYYKLLEDFNTYDCITEEAAPQGDVTQTYPEAFEDILRDEIQSRENYRQKQEPRFNEAMAEIESFLESHSKADSVHYAEQRGIKLGAKDKKLNATEKAKLQELRAQDKTMYRMPPKAEPAPTFYSQMAKVVEGVKQEKLGAASVVSMLKGKGVKNEEIKWSGIEEWLEGKKSVTKQELLEFIQSSMLQLEEETLDYKEVPYSEDQQKQLDEAEAKRDEIAGRLADEWKKVTGEEFPIPNARNDLEASLISRIIDYNTEQKGAAFEGRLLKKVREDLKQVVYDNDYFGFDSWEDVLRSIHRHRKDFIKYYEMSPSDKTVINKYCNALNAYNELPNKISDEDSNRLRAIARETEPWNRVIREVKREHDNAVKKHMPRWGRYSLKGGSNYRELLFKMPESEYSNQAMYAHWESRKGVLVHARIQDFETADGKMLFVEELQSDWHNEGHKGGYLTKDESSLYDKAHSDNIRTLENEMDNYLQSDEAHNLVTSLMNYYDLEEESRAIGRLITISEFDFVRLSRAFPESVVNSNAYDAMVEYARERDKLIDEADRIYDIVNGKAPDAPFKDSYHEYVLKRLLRMAAEQGYDSIGWTPAQIQVERWSEEFAEGYRIEYDQDMPKFLNKYGKKWGAKVGKTQLDSGTEIWTMPITESMKESVVTEGQPMYRMPSKAHKQPAYQEWDVQTALYDALDHADKGRDNLIRVGNMPNFIVENLGIEGDFYIYRNHAYENMVSKEEAQRDGRFSSRGHYHDLGIDKMTDAVMALEDPIMTIATKTKDGNPAVIMLLPVLGKNKAPLYAVLSFYSNRDINGDYSKKPHIVLTIYERNLVEDNGQPGLIDIVNTAIEDGRIISYDKEKRDFLPVKTKLTRLSIIAEQSLNQNLTQFQKEIKTFKEKNKINYRQGSEATLNTRQLLANAFEGVAQNDIERGKIQEYKDKIDLVNAEEQKLRELRAEIKELSFAKGPKDTDRIQKLQQEAAKTANRITVYDKQLLRLEASKPLQAVVEREKAKARKKAEQKGREALRAEREKAAKIQRQMMENYRERQKKAKLGRDKTAMRHKIQDIVNELNNYLLKGNKDKHVMIGLQKAVASALDVVNMDTTGAEERLKALSEKIAKETDPIKLNDLLASYRRIMEQGEKMSEKLAALRTAYAEIKDSKDPLVANSHDEVIEAAIESVAQKIGDTPLRVMSMEQLQEVYDLYKMVLTRIRDSNKAFAKNKKESISQMASNTQAEVEAVGGKKKLGLKSFGEVNKFLWNNFKPIFAFKAIGSNTLSSLFDNVRAGEDVWARDVSEARAFYLEQSKKYGYDSWDLEETHHFTSTSELNFKLNLEQMMSIYAYSKRKQAEDHLMYGGIVFENNFERTKLFGKFNIKLKTEDATAYNISPETLAEIIGKLSDEQRAFVDVMQEYLSTVMGEKGNEVSLAMYGVKLFKEKFYFPLRSSSAYMAKAREQARGEVKIKNSGFTKETAPHATNPIVLESFMDVWASHVDEMSMYHAFTLPLEDFYRVYNYKTPNNDPKLPAEGVNPAIVNAYGKAATNYIEQMLKDLNGGARTDPTAGIINKLMGKFKKGQVLASASVVVQQPSSVARALALIDGKYFRGKAIDAKKHKELWKELKHYAPVVIIKEMGYFDTNTGKSTVDYLKGREYTTGREKLEALVKDGNYRDELLSKAPAMADELAWCQIWQAVKRETAAKYPSVETNSEAFLELAGKRFTQIVTETQVYDSVLSRSANMRSKDTGMKMATAFLSEPTTAINMVADALIQGKRGDKTYARKTIGAVIAAQIINSALAAIVYAWRDDDEDETYLEKYLASFVGGTIDSLNPFTYIPFVRDIVSIIQGYDVERSDMAAIADLWKAIQQLDSDSVTGWRKVEDLVGNIALFFGIPVKNIMRDARGIFQTFDSFLNGENFTAAGLGHAVKGAAAGKDVGDGLQLLEARIKGDKAHEERVMARFDDEKDADSAVRTAIRDCFNDGTLNEDEAIVMLENYADMDADDAYWKVQEWKNTKNNSEWTRYDALYEAILADDKSAFADAQEALGDHGIAPSSVRNEAKNQIKRWYQAEEQQMDKQTAIRALQTYAGMSKIAAEHDVDEWSSFVVTGIAYDDISTEFIKGNITAYRAEEMLIKYGHLYARDAAEKVKEWQMEKDTGLSYSKLNDAYIHNDVTEYQAIDYLMQYGQLNREEAEAKILDWQAARDYGVTLGSTTEGIKKALIEGYISDETAKTIMMVYDGKTAEEAEDYVNQYRFTAETGYNFSEITDAYAEGVISKAEMERWYRDASLYTHGSEEVAKEYAEVADWKAYVPYGESMNRDGLEKWNKYGHNVTKVGLGKSDFARAWGLYNAAESQYDYQGNKTKEKAQVFFEKLYDLHMQGVYTLKEINGIAYAVYSSSYVRKYKVW